jgi:hypothetical protein
MTTIPDQLNDLVERGEKDRGFQIMCCQNWRRFRDDEGIADDLADYARDAFPKGTSREQDLAIRAFPTEPLRLLRAVLVQVLHCPNDPEPSPRPSPVTLRFRAERAPEEVASIVVEFRGNNEALVTFRAAEVV